MDWEMRYMLPYDVTRINTGGRSRVDDNRYHVRHADFLSAHPSFLFLFSFVSQDDVKDQVKDQAGN